DQLAYPFEKKKGRVSFIRMKDTRGDSQPGEHSHAADSEDHLLLDASLLIAAVESRCQLAIPGLVLLDISVHEVERYRADFDSPDCDMYLPSIEMEIDQTTAGIARDYRLNRRSRVVEALVDLHLAAFR